MINDMAAAVHNRMKQLHRDGVHFNDGDWDLTAFAVVDAIDGLTEPSAISAAIRGAVSEYADAGMCDQPRLVTEAITTAALAALRRS